MIRHREEDGPVDRRRRRGSRSSSPEPYRNPRRSREWRRPDYRRSDSQSPRRNKHGGRYSYGHKASRLDRSRSPLGRSDWRYEHDHTSMRRNDQRGEVRSKRSYRSNPQSPRPALKQEDDRECSSVKDSEALPSQQDAFKRDSITVARGTPPAEKQRPNFSTTGRLAAESNTIKSADGQAIVLKYHEPAEARKPPQSQPWRMYIFKGPEIIDTVELSQRSCWLLGREAAVVDVLVEHPSCSKQHAVVQFRYVERKNEFGDKSGMVKPYLIDLESANGTSMNGENVLTGRYLELRDKDVFQLGHSSREYVLQLPP